jgi:hypothetical protein
MGQPVDISIVILFCFLFPSSLLCDSITPLGESFVFPNPNPSKTGASSSSLPFPTPPALSLSLPFFSNLENNMINPEKTHPIHNLIPRFKIPRGNLSFLANPQWEALYFLKYGQFPLAPSNHRRNANNFLDKLYSIKDILEGKSDRAQDILQKVVNDLKNKEREIYESSPEGTELSMIDPETFFTFHGTLGAYTPTVEEAQRMLNEYEKQFGIIPKVTIGDSVENDESNFLDGLTLQLKAKPDDIGKVSERGSSRKKKDGIMKYLMAKNKPYPYKAVDKQEDTMNSVGIEPIDLLRHFILNRKLMADQNNQKASNENMGTGRNYYGIMSRSDPEARDSGKVNMDDYYPEIRQDQGDRTEERKFETQGWK